MITLTDGIGCYDWQIFENAMATGNLDLRALKGAFPAGCLKVNAPFMAVVESIDATSTAVCIRGGSFNPACFWFPIDNVRTLRTVDQRRT